MKSPRNILIFAAVAILIAVTALVQAFNIVASRHRELVQQELRKLLGKEVSFESLEVHLFGRPGFAAKSFRIADDPRFAATPIIRARQLILGVKLWPLLAGRIVIDSLVFNQPEFQIITDETGLLNLDLLSRRRGEIATLPPLRSALREKIPRELEITGPMWFQATAAGTLSRPRLEKITLKAPLFGASDYNAFLTGAVEFSQRHSWEDAQLNGKLTIDPLPVARLRKLSWFQQNQSANLVTDGTMSLFGRFEGTWSTLRVGALIRAGHADLRYRNWLAKRAEYPLEIRARLV